MLTAVAVCVPAAGIAALATGDRATGGLLLLGTPLVISVAGWPSWGGSPVAAPP